MYSMASCSSSPQTKATGYSGNPKETTNFRNMPAFKRNNGANNVHLRHRRHQFVSANGDSGQFKPSEDPACGRQELVHKTPNSAARYNELVIDFHRARYGPCRAGTRVRRSHILAASKLADGLL